MSLPPSSKNSLRWRLWVAALLLVGMVLAVYGQVLSYSLVEYDDTALLAGNPYVRDGLSLAGVKWAIFFQDGGQTLRAGVENLWHPVTWISHMLDYELWGADYRWHHATSLGLHLVATLLVFWIFSKWLRSSLGGVMVACLFAIHPMHVEPVAWLSDRKGLLSACGFLLSLGFYQQSGGTTRNWRVASALVFGLALLAKPSVVVLPGILALLDWYEKRKEVPHEPRAWLIFQISDKANWWVPAFLVSGITLMTQGGGTHGVVGSLSARVVAMPANFVEYLVKLVWPVGLTFHNVAPSYASSMMYGAVLWLVVTGLMVVLWTQRERQRDWFVSGVWMLLCWLPISGLVVVGTSFTSDRYSYLMFCGAFFGIVSVWLNLFSKWKVYAIGLALAVVSGLSVLAFQQVKVWKTSESLFAHAYRWQPQDLTVVINHATMTQRLGKVAESLILFEQARQIAPQDPVVLYNLAVVEASGGNFAVAAKNCREAVAFQPGFSPAWLQLGLMLARGDVEASSPDEARVCLERASETSRWKDPKAILALAEAYEKSGRRSDLKALVERTRALKISDPRLAGMMEQWRQQFH